MASNGPIAFQVSNSGGSTGAVNIPAGGGLQAVAQIAVNGFGKVLIVGTVGGAGPLTQYTIAVSAVSLGVTSTGVTDSSSGKFVTELATTGDYATPAGILERSTPSPNTAASGTSFRQALDLEGAVGTLLISAASANGATLTIDACGKQAVTG